MPCGFAGTSLCQRDHSWRRIARFHVKSPSGHVKGINPCSAVDLQDALSEMESAVHFVPDSAPLSATDGGIRKIAVVSRSDAVERRPARFCDKVLPTSGHNGSNLGFRKRCA